MAVDPVDTFVRSGVYATPLPLPFVVGRDLVGEVAAAGPGAVGFAPGQRVWCNSLGHAGRQGSFAEYATVAAERLYAAPPGLADHDLVAAAHPAASAWLALLRHGRLRTGETVYIGGGAGIVGGAAVALASRAGARVVTTARQEDADRLLALGAAEVLDYRAPDLAPRLRRAAPGGYDVQLDTSGHGVLADAVDLLAHGGRLIAMVGLGWAGQPPNCRSARSAPATRASWASPSATPRPPTSPRRRTVSPASSGTRRGARASPPGCPCRRRPRPTAGWRRAGCADASS